MTVVDGSTDAEHATPLTDEVEGSASNVDRPANRWVRLRRRKSDEGTGRQRVTAGLVVSLAIVVALGGLTGWLTYRVCQSRTADRQRAIFLETARQEAVNLTTISYTEIDTDIKRIIDAATGSFRDDFQKRSTAFADVVKQSQSKTVGTVTAAGVESMAGDQAQVLVALSVKTSSAGAPEGQPRGWRMRISVSRVGNDTKVSEVLFVP